VSGPNRTYCAQQARRGDFDRYLCFLFGPAERREELFALLALNIEIAKTREIVSEPLIGHIRLQWWRDALGALFAGQAPNHQVLAALAPAAWQGRLTRAHIDRLIDAREADLGNPPPTMDALESYAEATSSTLLWLAADLCQVPDDSPLRKRVQPVGIAWALTGLIRAIPFHARAGRRFIPDDVLAHSGLRERDLFDLRPCEALRAAVATLAAAAQTRLSQVRGPPRDVRALFLPAVLASAYLRKLERRGGDILAKPLELSRLTKIALLTRAALMPLR
jgi:phytoene synthase